MDNNLVERSCLITHEEHVGS